MKIQIPNINRVRSAWRRVKEDIKDAIIRDLKPVKDVKGGGVTGESKPATGGGTARAPQAATNKHKVAPSSPRDAFGVSNALLLDQLRAS